MNVPKLRFKDEAGRDFPDWEERSLSEVSKINQGLQIPISERFGENGKGRHFYITNEFLKSDSKNQYFIANPPESVLCVEDDILMTRTGNTGKVVTGVRGAFHNNFFKIKYDKNLLNKVFLCEFLTLNKTQSLILKLAGTSTIPDLNHSDFYKIKTQFPILPEQTKIANFLTAVDEKITQLTQKCDLLAQYKKGVMQQIFSQELRFNDDGRDFPEWEVKALGDVTEVIMGQSPESSSYNDLATGKPLIQGNADITNRKTSPRAWTTAPTKECKVNDIILTVRAPVGAVAIAYHDACIGRGVCAIRSNEKTISCYVYQLLLWFEPTKWVSLEQGSTFTAVSSKDIRTIDIPFPSIAEQTKIANFFIAIDDKISNAQAQLAAVKQYKQGLLQQMFV